MEDGGGELMKMLILLFGVLLAVAVLGGCTRRYYYDGDASPSYGYGWPYYSGPSYGYPGWSGYSRYYGYPYTYGYPYSTRPERRWDHDRHDHAFRHDDHDRGDRMRGRFDPGRGFSDHERGEHGRIESHGGHPSPLLGAAPRALRGGRHR